MPDGASGGAPNSVPMGGPATCVTPSGCPPSAVRWLSLDIVVGTATLGDNSTPTPGPCSWVLLVGPTSSAGCSTVGNASGWPALSSVLSQLMAQYPVEQSPGRASQYASSWPPILEQVGWHRPSLQAHTTAACCSRRRRLAAVAAPLSPFEA